GGRGGGGGARVGGGAARRRRRGGGAPRPPAAGRPGPPPPAPPPAPARTASDVNPSARACSPSATRAAEPIRRPAWIRYRATTSLAANPISAAAPTATSPVTGRGPARRGTAPHRRSTAGPAGTPAATPP